MYLFCIVRQLHQATQDIVNLCVSAFVNISFGGQDVFVLFRFYAMFLVFVFCNHDISH